MMSLAPSYVRATLRLGTWRFWRESALTVGAIVGLVCIVSTVAVTAFDMRPLIFRSGSMSPTITTGSLAFSRSVSANDLKVGDIVSVRTGDQRVTHRIARITHTGDHASLILRGDANPTVDDRSYRVREADRVFFHVPKLGYVIHDLSGPVGIFAGGLLSAVLMFVIFKPGPRRSGGSESGRRRRKGRGRRIMVGLVAVGLLGSGALGVGRAAPSWATFTDSATVTGGAFAAYTVPKPALTCATTGNVLSGYTMTISWPVVTSPQALGYSALITGDGTVLAVTSSSGTASVQLKSGLLSSVLGASSTVRVTANLPGTSPSWTSTPANQNFNTGLLGLSFGCSGTPY